MVTRSAAVGADVRLEYVETGDPKGLPVVFLHGVTDSWTSFEGTMERLPESIRAIAVSQRGHGNSSRQLRGISWINQHCQFLILHRQFLIPLFERCILP
jgi:pimeloyl-ACP methyl ester carboxylesterase